MLIRDIFKQVSKGGARVLESYSYPLAITYEDGQDALVSFNHLYFDYYLQRSFFEHFKHYRLKYEYTVQKYLQEKSYHTSSHLDLIQTIVQDLDATAAVDFFNNAQKEELYAVIIEATESIYNALTDQSRRYSLSIDIVDFMDIENNPEVQQAIALDTVDHQSIYNAYDSFNKVVGTMADKLPNNQILKFFRSKTVNLNQLLQCMVYRGFVTEVDGSILPNPVMGNYLRGMYKAYDFMAESRSAAKALYFSEAPLQDAEYFARRLQLLTTVVETVDSEHITDCGTDGYMYWHVKPRQVDETGRETSPGDLKYLVGKYYIDNNGNRMEIKANSKHLIGEVLKLRTVLHCKHPKKKHVCATCFGATHKNVSKYANIGHLAAATMTQQSSQSVLSTKHLDVSSASNRIALTAKASEWLMINKSNEISLRREHRRHLTSIVIDKDSAPALLDVFAVENIENINPRRISSITNIDLRITKQNDTVSIALPLAKYNKSFMLSYPFLKYIKEKGYRVDDNNNFEFDMTEWPFEEPIMKYPEKEYSYSDHSKQISRMIESAIVDTMEIDDLSPTSILQELFMLVNSKLKVNLVCLEVIIYAASIFGKDNFDLSRHSEKPVMGKADTTIRRRSMSGLYAYEQHLKTITSPYSFDPTNRPNSVMDVFVCPKETVENRKAIGSR